MEHKGFKEALKDPQMIIAICVILLSLCALFVSLFQAKVMNEQRDLMLQQAKAAVWPRLEFGINKSHELSGKITAYKLGVANQGVGPAIITGVKITYDSTIITNWGQLFKKFKLSDSVNYMTSNSNVNDIVLQAGANNTILNLSNNLPLAQAFYDHSTKLKIEIFYKSIYDDIWNLTIPSLGSNKKHSVEKVQQMPLINKEQFSN